MAMKKENLPEVVPEVTPQVFELEDYGQIRFVWKGEEIWFVAADVCRALDIKNVTRALAKLDDDEKDKIPENGVVTDPNYYEGSTVTPFLHEINIISEPGLYRLVFASRKKKAKDFQRKVYHEVLPSIRKYGFYSVDEKNLIELPYFETDEEWFEYYDRLKEQIPYMTEEEILALSDDPDIFVYKVNGGE